MRLPWPWLDRLWLITIAIAFLVITPLYTILLAQRMGWLNLTCYLLFVFLVTLYTRIPD